MIWSSLHPFFPANIYEFVSLCSGWPHGISFFFLGRTGNQRHSLVLAFNTRRHSVRCTSAFSTYGDLLDTCFHRSWCLSPSTRKSEERPKEQSVQIWSQTQPLNLPSPCTEGREAGGRAEGCPGAVGGCTEARGRPARVRRSGGSEAGGAGKGIGRGSGSSPASRGGEGLNWRPACLLLQSALSACFLKVEGFAAIATRFIKLSSNQRHIPHVA